MVFFSPASLSRCQQTFPMYVEDECKPSAGCSGITRTKGSAIINNNNNYYYYYYIVIMIYCWDLLIFPTLALVISWWRRLAGYNLGVW